MDSPDGIWQVIRHAIKVFCDKWGNFASVAGLFVSVVGFIAAIRGITSAKRSAQQAERAANEAKQRILKNETIAAFATATRVMEAIMDSHRRGHWPFAIERYTELRRLLVELKGRGTGISEEQRTIIQGAMMQFSAIEAHVEKQLAENSVPNVPMLNGIVTKQIVNIHEIAISLKSD